MSVGLERQYVLGLARVGGLVVAGLDSGQVSVHAQDTLVRSVLGGVMLVVLVVLVVVLVMREVVEMRELVDRPVSRNVEMKGHSAGVTGVAAAAASDSTVFTSSSDHTVGATS